MAYEEFEKPYYRLRAALLSKLLTEGTAADLNNTLARNGQPLGAHTGVRLSQISLPEFDGDYKGWLSFKSTYVSLIHDSGELNDVQKFHYLKTALKGEAAKLIESLTLTNDNYSTAITKRYSNEYLLKKHLQALMEYPKVEKESSTAIHARVDEFEQRLKILKQLLPRLTIGVLWSFIGCKYTATLGRPRSVYEGPDIHNFGEFSREAD